MYKKRKTSKKLVSKSIWNKLPKAAKKALSRVSKKRSSRKRW